MRMLLGVISAAAFCALGGLTQNTPGSSPGISWCYHESLTLANAEGNSNPNRPVSFINDTLWDFDISQPFSITARLRVSDTRFWRAAISIESPDATYSLFRVALPPSHMMFNVAWMRSARARGGAINTTAVARGPNVDFHFALVKDEQNIAIYVDGRRQALHPFSGQIFNPRNKQIVLGRNKVDGHTNRDQWSGRIGDVRIWRGALSAVGKSPTEQISFTYFKDRRMC